MAEDPKTPTGGGVQELINRIRDEGVATARAEADQILAAARTEAQAIRAQAEQDARVQVEQARTQVETDQAAGVEALKIAARDTLLEMKDRIRQEFKRHVRRLVSAETRDPEFIRSLVLTLAGHAADNYIKDEDAKILVSKAIIGEGFEDSPLSDEEKKQIVGIVLGASGEMLREGVELLPDSGVQGGARVRMVDQELEIDLTDEAVSRTLLKHLLPRYRTIVKDEMKG